MTTKIKSIILASFFLVGLSLQVLMFVDPSSVLAQTPSTTTAPTGSKALPGVTNSYSGKGVQASIEAVLCTPTNASYSPAETDGSTGTTAATSSASGGDLAKCINRLYRAALAFGSVSAVFFVVLAGYLYMVGGEKGKHRAKEMLLSVIVGIIIILASYTLLRQINPTLIAFRTIQPPQLTTQYGRISCSDLNLGQGDACVTEGGGQGFSNGSGGYTSGKPGSSTEAKVSAIIDKYAKQFGMGYCELAGLIEKESTFQTNVVSFPPPNQVDTSKTPPTYGISFEGSRLSDGHAIGLTQIMIYPRNIVNQKTGQPVNNEWGGSVPARNGKAFGFDRPLTVQDLIDPDINIHAGAYYFSNLIKTKGSVFAAYKAYTGGYSDAIIAEMVKKVEACKLRR